jgi:hypothetical protein
MHAVVEVMVNGWAGHAVVRERGGLLHGWVRGMPGVEAWGCTIGEVLRKLQERASVAVDEVA